MQKTESIQIRDPYILPVESEQRYYLFGTTDKRPWDDQAEGFDCYRSTDLENWEGPFPAFTASADFWATQQFWAPEVHDYQSRYYMLASFKAPNRFRGTQILVAERPEGPYVPWTDGPVTPEGWQCLDGTLHVDEKGQPWMVFCHEWVQVSDGAMMALPLATDLRSAVGRPVYLFSASEAPWVTRDWWPDGRPARPLEKKDFPNYVTDGPYLYRTRAGVLLMLWSSIGTQGYAMGIARSESGQVKGPWVQDPEPLWRHNGGHGMIFRTFEGPLMLAIHRPNETPNERAVFHELRDEGDRLVLV